MLFVFQLPSLFERKEDIPVLLKHYINLFSEENGIAPLELSHEALNVLVQYPWPGNIRELRNFCENIIIMKQGQTLASEDLEAKFLNKILKINRSPPLQKMDL